MKTWHSPAVLARILLGVTGALSIVGAIGAAAYSAAREPERYLAAAFVLFAAGIAWLVCSINPNYQLSRRELALIAGIVSLGLLFGLASVFHFCGGECDGRSFCHWYHGYPGRWLRTAGCGDITHAKTLMALRNWSIDVPNLAADVLFWSGTGELLLFVKKTLNSSYRQG